MSDFINIKGARQNNLNNISLKIPRNQFVAFTGVSGSGKSSLVYNTIYAEGQKRLTELLSVYERSSHTFHDTKVDEIEGLSATILIKQKTALRNVRSTVGTLTELYSYLRLLFSRSGHALCPVCGQEIHTCTKKDILKWIFQLPAETQLVVYAPILVKNDPNLPIFVQELAKKGLKDFLYKGESVTVEQAERICTKFAESESDGNGRLIYVRIGKAQMLPSQRKKIQDYVDEGMKISNGLLYVESPNMEHPAEISCGSCGLMISRMPASAFSFNTEIGACSVCTGIGEFYCVEPDKIIPDPSLSVLEGAIDLTGWRCEQDKFHKNRKILEALSRRYDFSLKTPFEQLSCEAKEAILYGTKGEKIDIENPSVGGKPMKERFVGVVNVVYNRFHAYSKTESAFIKEEDRKVMQECICPACQGSRLKPERNLYTLGGCTIGELSAMPLQKLREFCKDYITDDSNNLDWDKSLLRPGIMEFIKRLDLICAIGLGYLSVERPIGTLSGGEAQRLRLCSQLGAGLIEMIYIIDEISIGLHARDVESIVGILRKLKDNRNSVLVIEHNEAVISQADYIIDIGPEAGVRGGNVVAAGTVEEVKNNPNSVTGQYLLGKKRISVPKRRAGSGKVLRIEGAKEKNLKNVNVEIPLGCFVGVTGVSGAGKSTLVNDIIYRKLKMMLNDEEDKNGPDVNITGAEWIDDIIYIDQLPIGKSSRSNPAIYVGIFDQIRKLFARTEEARKRKYKEAHFSFNSPEGQCEVCSGHGKVKTEMFFMPAMEHKCEACQGKRYNSSVLEITYKGKTIADVLDMSIEQAAELFHDQEAIFDKLDLMKRMGIGYIKLGQSSSSLSGGESQRIKLVEELSGYKTGKHKLYILDEPTTGMHLDDIKKLLKILQGLVEQGNTVVVIEHNLQLIKTVDYIIDIGPEGGENGGKIVAAGTPEEVAMIKESYTGQYLKIILEKQGAEV